MVVITFVCIDAIFAFYSYVDFNFSFNPSLLLSRMFEHDCVVHMLFWVSYMHVFVLLYLHLISAVEHASHGKAL